MHNITRKSSKYQPPIQVKVNNTIVPFIPPTRFAILNWYFNTWMNLTIVVWEAP